MNQKKSKSSIQKLLSIFVILAVVIALTFAGLHVLSSPASVPASNITVLTPQPTVSTRSITLSVIGDIMAHGPQNRDAYDSATKTYNYSHSLRYVRERLRSADLAVGNLETTFAGGPNYSGYPLFNTPESLAGYIKDVGIDLVSTANNHSLDRGFQGLTSTIRVLDAAGIDHLGSYATEESRNENSGIVIKEIDGISIAFLSYSYGTNANPIPNGKEFCINIIYEDFMTDFTRINKDSIIADLDAAKALNTDLICVFMHWGTEYRLKQSSAQEELATLLFENGADIILGGHPHVLEPMEIRSFTTADGEEKEGFVCFSLGNFISSQNDEYTDTTVILNLEITKDFSTGQTAVSDVSYVPLMMLDKETGASERYLLLDARDAMSEYEAGDKTVVTDAVYAKLQKAIDDCHMILGEQWDIVN